jgi:small subunit ribosomal protein S2
VAEGLIARSGVKTGDTPDATAAEPLAEWERELLGGEPAEAAVGEAPTEAPAEPTDADVEEDATETTPAPEATAPADEEFGADSAAPLEDGSAPEGFEIKGNKNSMKFHAPSSPWYARTNAEVWFRTAEAAEAAGFANAEASPESTETTETTESTEATEATGAEPAGA